MNWGRLARNIGREQLDEITDTGYEVLSVGVPRTIAEIEALMKNDGILQILKKYGG